MEGRTTNELVRIASAGGGLRFNGGGRVTDELVRIASATASGGGHLYLTGMSGRTTDEFVRIASAGQGRVTIES